MPKTISRKEAIERIAAEGANAGSLNNAVRSDEKAADLFGSNVFNISTMRQMLPRQALRNMIGIRTKGTELDRSTADVVAAAMKDWAMARGATHYCHWFHPLTGLTAEKHQSFLTPTEEGGVLTEFTGDNLLQGEPDASSFPSGGVRSTFEARGYTGWDPTGDAFLMEGAFGKTLCIPSIFLGLGGHALDKKLPLLRSMEALSREALRILRLFGDTKTQRVTTTVGCEQEYFLIDRRFVLARPDLATIGRTVYGAHPPKGQEMEDHYFGSIGSRALAYMEDLERELYKVGIPVTTRHNEVAPSQYEIAPVFESANVATDHNMLMMSVMQSVARRHGFECLLHEKPFAGVNGSGKHNNWSMADDHGSNLLDPGQTPHDNAQFLVFLTAVIRAIHLHAPLMRAGIATPGNDYRLGGNEAPPAIISIYLGDELMEVVKAIIAGGTAKARGRKFLDIGVSTLPPLPAHDSDRNRTSPFAFTGTKFEFRAVGSGQSIARPNMILNTIIADSLGFMADAIEQQMKAGTDIHQAVRKVVHDTLEKHQAVLYNGDNYSEEWRKEAEKRGLPNLPTAVDALPALVDPAAVELFERQKVLSKAELQSRYNIKLGTYIKTLGIEAALMSNIGRTMILPAALRHQRRIAKSVSKARELLGMDKTVEQFSVFARAGAAVEELAVTLKRLDRARSHADSLNGDALKCAQFYKNEVLKVMETTRTAADVIENLVEDSLWPLPKYREILFIS